MKIGETISYKGYTIKRGIGIRPYYVKECGVFAKTEKQAKDFIDNMGKDAITLDFDKALGELNRYIERGK